MRLSLLIVLLAVLNAAGAVSAQTGEGRLGHEVATAAAVVDFNQPDTYRALFEAGLKPKRAYLSGGEVSLEIRPAQAVGFRIGHLQIPAREGHLAHPGGPE